MPRLCSRCQLWQELLHCTRAEDPASLVCLLDNVLICRTPWDTPLKILLVERSLPDYLNMTPMHGRQECAAEWATGRQQCEAVSLTGRACRLAPHGASAAHCSGARLLLASQDGTSRCCSAQTQWLFR